MKFETIKRQAKAAFAGHFSNLENDPPLATGGSRLADAQHAALLPFVLATSAERKEMREFAAAFLPSEYDGLGSAAKPDRGFRQAWSEVVLRAREAGLKIIDRWDVRRVGKLIELFPECAPPRMRSKPLTCYLDDAGGDSEWVVEVA